MSSLSSRWLRWQRYGFWCGFAPGDKRSVIVSAAVTFAQLRSFATVARLGSVSAAAGALGVSEPAVSAAVAALRRDLGDPLFVRAGTGIRLTAGGERLAARAAEILGLEDRARREVREARGERGLLRLAGAPTVAEDVSAPLLAAFTRRRPKLEVAQEIVASRDFP